jgi:hypothetical protein
MIKMFGGAATVGAVPVPTSNNTTGSIKIERDMQASSSTGEIVAGRFQRPGGSLLILTCPSAALPECPEPRKRQVRLGNTVRKEIRNPNREIRNKTTVSQNRGP